jgi:hypothetical protein
LEVRIARRITCKVACLGLLAMALPAVADARGLTLTRAERVARQAVEQHDSYREMSSSHSPLATRSCWRAAGRAVRCSLYALVPSACDLDPHREMVCAQALWERRWLVQVKRNAGGKPAARIVRISSGPAA